jgi:hypothetical protein
MNVRMTRYLLVLLLAAATQVRCAAAEVAAREEAKSPAMESGELETLVGQLDSNRYLDRERATQTLLAAGATALDPLLTAANSGRPEPADRAVWVLKKLGESTDRDLALAALDRLVAVKDRPAVVHEATLARGRIYELACQESLAKLGAKLMVQDQLSPEQMPVRLVHIDLTDKWRGTPEDLQCLANLRDHRYFRIEGSVVGDAEVRIFEDMDGLALLQIWKTRVTPAAVDAIKDRQPKAVVYVRKNALLGIGGATHEKGVLVTESRPSTGAANAGILKDDVITSLDGKPVQDFDRLTARIAQYEPGQEIEVTLLRGGEEMTKRVSLSNWKDFE